MYRVLEKATFRPSDFWTTVDRSGFPGATWRLVIWGFGKRAPQTIMRDFSRTTNFDQAFVNARLSGLSLPASLLLFPDDFRGFARTWRLIRMVATCTFLPPIEDLTDSKWGNLYESSIGSFCTLAMTPETSRRRRAPKAAGRKCAHRGWAD